MISEKELKKYKRKFANLIATMGLCNVKGSYCKIQADIDDPEFVTYLVDELYQLGAKRVFVYWTYRPILRTVYRYTSQEELSRVYSPEIERIKFERKTKMLAIRLESDSPDWMGDIDPNKVAEVRAAHQKVIRPLRKFEDDIDLSWNVSNVPSKVWAKKLFPKDDENTALLKFWEKIIICCHLKDDPIKYWKQYNIDIKKRAKWLDSLKIESLHYTSKNGTDLTVGIHPDTLFVGGAHITSSGKYYNPNFPTAECYTTPDRLKVNGVVYATRPLVVGGQLIEGFSLRFRRGKIVKVKARKGEQLLKRIIQSNENADYLGEAALVPFDSPISNTKTIYYATLLDENASCHFAFGRAINNTFKDNLIKLNKEQLLKRGINQSNIHIDFMIGNKNLNIIAKTRSGKNIPIFLNGNWAKKL